MASIHRKLFPASTTTNQTQDCPDFCDPACPYNCYPFPDYYYPPPPPPSSDDSTTGSHISFFLIILASLCIVIFILYVIKVKCYATWCGWRNNGPASFRSDGFSEEFLDDDQLDHHVWLITTVGLNQSIINSITVCKYKKGEGLIEGTECSVCLNEFQEDETLRLLPKCNHAFHIPCIDTWLRSHTNCPLCRAGIVSLSNNVSTETGMATLAPIQENGNISGRSQEIQIENFQNEVELRNNDNMLGIASVELLENRAETREGQELNNESNCKQIGIANNGDEVVQEDSGIDEAQKVVRSVSMDYRSGCSNSDSWGSANSCSNLVKKDGEYTSMLKTTRGSSIAQCLHLKPISMKRSLSCSGRIVYRGNRI